MVRLGLATLYEDPTRVAHGATAARASLDVKRAQSTGGDVATLYQTKALSLVLAGMPVIRALSAAAPCVTLGPRIESTVKAVTTSPGSRRARSLR